VFTVGVAHGGCSRVADQGGVCFFSDKVPHQEINRIWLEPYETPLCSHVAKLEACKYVAVGTAIATSYNLEPHFGRVIVFDVGASSSADTSVVMAWEVDGGVCDMSVTQAGYLICSISNAVYIYSIHVASNESQRLR